MNNLSYHGSDTNQVGIYRFSCVQYKHGLLICSVQGNRAAYSYEFDDFRIVLSFIDHSFRVMRAASVFQSLWGEGRINFSHLFSSSELAQCFRPPSLAEHERLTTSVFLFSNRITNFTQSVFSIGEFALLSRPHK
jgi:hypothetical protein